jgi:micrococcal nuclease
VVVVGHTDGDTIRVRLAEDGAAGARGRRISVRLLEIDAPESKDPDRLVQCFAREASVALARLMPVGSVAWGLVDRDVLDRYGRTLLYLRTLHAGRQTFVNEWLAAQGFARAALYPPNDRYIDAIGAAARRARRHRRGLWGACG